MTKEITKAIILQEIQDKFKLRNFAPAKFLFDETVIPVYNVEQHLENVERIEKTIAVDAGTVAKLFFLVPQTERWRLRRYNVIFMTGSYTVSGLMIGRPDASKYVYIDLTAGQNTSYAHDLPKEVVLNPNETIYLYIDGYTSTGNLLLICDVIKEEIR